MVLWILRGGFAILILAVALQIFGLGWNDFGNPLSGSLLALGCLAIGAVILIGDLRVKEKQIARVSSIFFGLLVGMMVGWLASLIFDSVIQAGSANFSPTPETAKVLAAKVAALLRVLVTGIAAFIAVSWLLQTRNDFRFIIPFVEFTKQIKGGRPLVLDTSVIIDGRIADLCETRLIDTRLIVPKFILQELQGIADSSDKLKRNRGRRGMDILKKLQSNTKLDLQMHDGNAGELKPGEKMRVDERLVAFTKIVGGRVVTNDYNLNKIAQLQGVDVINLNEVANSLKTVALPGEYLILKVVKAGDQIGQGVGYLDDGTMVVVESGRNLIGQECSIVVTSVLQTPAGRMIFGRPEQRQSGSYVPLGMSGEHEPVKPEKSSPVQPKPNDPPKT